MFLVLLDSDEKWFILDFVFWSGVGGIEKRKRWNRRSKEKSRRIDRNNEKRVWGKGYFFFIVLFFKRLFYVYKGNLVFF